MKPFWLGLLGSFVGFMLLAGMAFWADIFTVDRDGTIHIRVTDDGRVGIGGAPSASAVVEMASISKGFLMPRMTTAQRNAISNPATGLEIYNITTNRAERYNGSAWKPVGISNVGARVYNNAAQSISNATGTSLSFNTERYDADAIHDTSSNTTRLTCNTAGKYLIVGNIDWAPNAAGRRLAWISHSGGAVIAFVDSGVDSGGFCGQNLSGLYELAVGDYVELGVYQTSGGALNVNGNDAAAGFGMTLIQE